MERPTIKELLPVQTKAILDFVNQAKTTEDLTDVEKHRPDLSKEELSSYSIGEQSAQNILDTRAGLRGQQFNSIEELLEVKGIGDDKVLDIAQFIWRPAAAAFRAELFDKILGENWTIDFWRYPMDEETFERTTNSEELLQAFVGEKVKEIVVKRHENYAIGSLAEALLKKSDMKRFDGSNAQIQFASWWYRFDQDNWFSFERISEVIDTYINHYDRHYIDLAFYRGFLNGGTVASAITADDLVVGLNPAEYAITIWGISLFD